VDACCRQSVVNDPNQILSTHDDGFKITRELIAQFHSKNHLSMPLFNACIRLLRVRESRIEIAYRESNRIDRPNRYYFADLEFMEKLLQRDFEGALEVMSDSSNYTKFFLPILKGSNYRLVIVDKVQKTINVFDPFLNCSMPPNIASLDYIQEDMPQYAGVIMSFLRAADIVDASDEASWLSPFPSCLFPNYKELVQYYEPITNACDSGIYVLTAIDYISNDVPCIFFVDSISHLRNLLAHQVLVQKFPI